MTLRQKPLKNETILSRYGRFKESEFKSKSHSQNLGGRIGTNGGSLNLGFSESASNLDQTTFNNSQLLAENGSLNINSKTDTNGTLLQGCGSVSKLMIDGKESGKIDSLKDRKIIIRQFLNKSGYAGVKADAIKTSFPDE